MSDTGLHYVIERQKPGRTFKYRVFFVDENGHEYMSDYADTLRGARRAARKLATKWRRYRNLPKYVDEGLL